MSVINIGMHGRAEGSVAPMAKWKPVVEIDDALARFQAAGFSGDPLWPKLDLDLTQKDEVERLFGRSLLGWAADSIRTADLGPPPVVVEDD